MSSNNKETSTSQELEQLAKNIETQYTKSNPFIFGQKQSNCPRFKTIYNAYKFSLVIIFAIIAMLSLWFITQWKSNTLSNLGIDFSKFKNNDNAEMVGKLVFSENELKLGLDSWKSSKIENWMFNLSLAFAFIGLFSLIPLLVFKNGTIFSFASSILILISLIIVLIVFIIGFGDQQKVVSIFKNTNNSNLETSFNEIRKLIGAVSN